MDRDWIIKKNKIYKLIKRVSDAHRGDDKEWLREYIQDVIEQNKNDLQKVLDALALYETDKLII